jgi:hypothetical protein
MAIDFGAAINVEFWTCINFLTAFDTNNVVLGFWVQMSSKIPSARGMVPNIPLCTYILGNTSLCYHLRCVWDSLAL